MVTTHTYTQVMSVTRPVAVLAGIDEKITCQLTNTVPGSQVIKLLISPIPMYGSPPRITFGGFLLLKYYRAWLKTAAENLLTTEAA